MSILPSNEAINKIKSTLSGGLSKGKSLYRSARLEGTRGFNNYRYAWNNDANFKSRLTGFGLTGIGTGAAGGAIAGAVVAGTNGDNVLGGAAKGAIGGAVLGAGVAAGYSHTAGGMGKEAARIRTAGRQARQLDIKWGQTLGGTDVY